ncbi:hypothetical protein CWE09_01870 [Aliidiomarina minuta]|uniref:Uncharacterized protein n=1 Tax=Aliidiomarina minuta TaxID=880057 RepID=A0A432W6A1_9GAMM|nr:hypothetical protein [Aliidiomarina minuta]RUO25509.1 hypothetical protein CWE09_01870 [Aliidiomarina minuta]
MDKICANCHFLGKQHSHQSHGEGVPFFIGSKERYELKKGNFSCISDMYSLRCLKEVWDERFNDNGIPLQDIVCQKNRENRCFFYPYDEGISFKAAEELQRRLQEHRQMKKSNKYTVIGLLIASMGLLINAGVELFRLLREGA